MRTGILNYGLEVIDGVPRAAFEGIDQHEKVLLTHFLHPAPHFVPDVLYEISLVERSAVNFSGFETDFIAVQFFSDHVVVMSRVKNVEEDSPSEILLSVEEAKLLLLEWGIKVLRWRMEQKKQI